MIIVHLTQNNEGYLSNILATDLENQINELCKEILLKKSIYNVKKVRFGGINTKGYLENDNWRWHIIARIEVALFGIEESW
jgi:hypothetical protein